MYRRNEHCPENCFRHRPLRPSYKFFCNLVRVCRTRHTAKDLMSASPHVRSQPRAPRVKLQGSVPVIIRLENGRQLRASMRQLSITGGLLELSTQLDEGASVDLTMHVSSAIVQAKAEMLFPMRATLGYSQPFRFTGLRTEERRRLETALRTLLESTTASATGGHGPDFRPPRFFLESF